VCNADRLPVDLTGFKVGDEETSGGRESMYYLPDGRLLGPDECLVIAMLLEGVGEFAAAESVYRKSRVGNDMQNYIAARLKLRAGETDRASSLLRQSVETGDPEVLGQLRLDEELWIEAVGTEGFEKLTTSTGDPATPGVGR